MKSFNGVLFGDKIKEFRGKMSQKEFADKYSINRATLSLIERAKQLPSLEFLSTICKEMNVPTTTFFEEQNNNGLIYLMGQLDDSTEISDLKERIMLREKYYALSQRCRVK
jgi:transcriptional regulator with XRE-family HTH domain